MIEVKDAEQTAAVLLMHRCCDAKIILALEYSNYMVYSVTRYTAPTHLRRS
jgi:hypothetical protein